MEKNSENLDAVYDVLKDKDTDEVTIVNIDKVGYNVMALFFNSFLLIAPLLFGIGIASLGNDEYIKRCFIELHHLGESMNQSNVTGKMFPAKVWSIGFVFPLGGWIGSLLAAFAVDRYGRKLPSIGFCLCGIIGSGLKFISRYNHIALLFLGRFFEGISSAGLMVSAVLLMFETIPRGVEKTFKSLIQIFVSLGILLISCASLYSIVDVNWNFAQLFSGGLATIMAIGLVFNKESPKYIENRYKDPTKTEKVLKALRGKFFEQKELEELKNLCTSSTASNQMTILQFIKTKRFLLANLTLLVMNISQQLSGINAIMAFAPRLLVNAGFNHPDVGATIISLFATIGAMLFAPFVAKLRRKFLWILGLSSMSISFILFIFFQELSVNPIAGLTCLCAFVFMFQVGPGPVVWFIAIEMYPLEANGAAQGAGLSLNWLANTLVYLLFPILEESMSHRSLIIFIVIDILCIIYSIFIMVETRNKTSEEVLVEYNSKTFLMF